MTMKERETLQRACGIIEGVSYGVELKAQEALVVVVEMLDGLMEGGRSDA